MLFAFKELTQKSIVIQRRVKKLVSNIVLAIKDGVFLLKLKQYFYLKTGFNIPKKFKKFKGGDWYHGEIAENYELKRARRYWWHEEIKILKKFLSFIPKGARVLDVPVGTARFLPLYLKNQMSMTGLDISSDMLDQAIKHQGDLLNGCQLDIGDARNLPYADNSFEVVVCFRLLDGQLTFKDVNKAIVEFCRVSQKYLILELGAFPQKHDDSKLTLKKLRKNQPIWNRLSEIERQKLLKMHRLKILDSETAYHNNGTPEMTIYFCEKSNENSPSFI